jgi:catechol 2,3-dioxygenase-like lactoylglutathione lyase family enzyme
MGCGGNGGPGSDAQEGEVAEGDAPLPTILATNAFYYYEDVDAAWAFYTGTLGFSTVADYGFAKILRVGPTSYLTLVDEERGMHSSSEPKSVTLAIISDEVEEWWEYLSELGVTVRSPLGVGESRPHDGFVVVDPEGYFLEFERFNPHPENVSLLPILDSVDPIFPDGTETAPGVRTTRPENLGVRGTVLWLYYHDLAPIEAFYSEALGVEILVDQGWAKVYPASTTGFLGFVDGERGLHEATDEKGVTVSFFTSGIEGWLSHMGEVEGFSLRTTELTSEETSGEDFVRTFVGYDPEGYFLEWDEFVDIDLNRPLLESLGTAGIEGRT